MSAPQNRYEQTDKYINLRPSTSSLVLFLSVPGKKGGKMNSSKSQSASDRQLQE